MTRDWMLTPERLAAIRERAERIARARASGRFTADGQGEVPPVDVLALIDAIDALQRLDTTDPALRKDPAMEDTEDTEAIDAAAGRLMGEAVALEEDYDLGVPATTPEQQAAYRKIAARRRNQADMAEALVTRAIVLPGDTASLLTKLRDLAKLDERERRHRLADRALLDFIDDPRVRFAYEELPKWYA